MRPKNSNSSLRRAVFARGGEWEEYQAASQEVLRLERKMAAARNEQYVEPIDFPVKWDTGAPLPQLFVNDYRALLTFLISVPDAGWDGSYVTVKDRRVVQAHGAVVGRDVAIDAERDLTAGEI